MTLRLVIDNIDNVHIRICLEQTLGKGMSFYDLIETMQWDDPRWIESVRRLAIRKGLLR